MKTYLMQAESATLIKKIISQASICKHGNLLLPAAANWTGSIQQNKRMSSPLKVLLLRAIAFEPLTQFFIQGVPVVL